LELNYVNGVYDSLEFIEDEKKVKLVLGVGKFSATSTIISLFALCNYLLTDTYIYVDFSSIDETTRDRVAVYNSEHTED
jgi:hypothetical protein